MFHCNHIRKEIKKGPMKCEMKAGPKDHMRAPPATYSLQKHDCGDEDGHQFQTDGVDDQLKLK